MSSIAGVSLFMMWTAVAVAGFCWLTLLPAIGLLYLVGYIP